MREEQIFHQALEQAADQRATFLDAACGSDIDLRERVVVLLRAQENPGSFLQSPAPGIGNSPTLDQAAERPGTQIGPYKLLQQIGEGGMGVVYMAEQTEPVQRKVALKVIKPGMDSRQVIARFEAERQALAMMDHVNIARVLDAGATESGRPYFVMELVHGIPITKYCDDNRLTPRQRLELFVPVCQAIQHAHQKGIIHRDIKPSNVMVTHYDGKPVPKVIDFGVAKATEQKLTERTLFTQYGTMVGTLEYMSPEQAEMSALVVDTRSDIYSLGVLLYELLTGSTPLSSKRMKEAAYAEILRLIKEEEPPKPSTRLSDSGEALASISANRHTEPAKLTKLMRGELDWIVMKTLEKDRNRRYETANGFAADVQRYLADEPVQACPPSAAYRLRKFARRNRAAVLTAATILFVLVAGIAGTTFGLIRAEHRRAEADNARANEAAQRKIAVAQKKKAEQAEADTLEDYRESTDDAIEQLISSKPDLGPQEKAYLEKTLKRWQVFAARQGDDLRSREIRAEGYRRVANLWLRLGRLKEARAKYETALELSQKLNADFPGVPQYRSEVIQAHYGLAYLLDDFGERDAARREWETALDLSQKLSADFPNTISYQWQVAYIHNGLAILLRDLGQRDLARTAFETSRDLRGKLAADFPNEAKYRFDFATTRHNLGVLLTDMGERDAARTELEAARDVERKLAADFPAVLEYRQSQSFTHNSLAILMMGLGKYDAARKELEAARDLRQKSVASFPAVPKYQLELASTHHNLGDALVKLGQRDAARTEYETARGLLQKLAADNPTLPVYQGELARTHRGLGNVLQELGQRNAARAEYETARDLYKKVNTNFPAIPAYLHSLALTHNSLGSLLNIPGERDAARAEYEAARDLQQKLAVEFPNVLEYQVDLGGSYCNLGGLVRSDGHPADSLHWFDLAIRTLTTAYEQDRRHVTAREYLRNSHWGRALSYDQLKKHDEALKDWDKVNEFGAGLQQRSYRLARAVSLLESGQIAGAVSLVEELSKDAKGSAPEWYRCACIFATASVQIDDRKQEYADRAMVFLAQAVEAGFKDLSHMARDRDLVPLHDRQDFLKLVTGPAATEFETDRVRLEKLVAEFPNVPQHQLELARTHQNYAMKLAALGLLDAARTEYETTVNLIRKLIAAFPTALQYQWQLGGSYNSYGFMVRNLGQPADSLHWFEQAIRTLTPVYERNPRIDTVRQLLRASHWGRAVAYDQLNKHTEAIQDWDKAIEFDTGLEQPGLRGGRAIARLKAGQSAEVVAEIDQFLMKAQIVTAGDWHSFACVYALASGKFADQKQMYGDRAMELLRRAVQAGYISAPLLAKDPHLEALRQREDFQKLIAELETRSKRSSGR